MWDCCGLACKFRYPILNPLPAGHFAAVITADFSWKSMLPPSLLLWRYVALEVGKNVENMARNMEGAIQNGTRKRVC